MKQINLANKVDISRLCQKIWDKTYGFYQPWSNKVIVSFLDRENICYNDYFPNYRKTMINYEYKAKEITIDFCFDNFGNNEYMRLFMQRISDGGYRWFFSNETTIVNYKDEEFKVVGLVSCDLYYWAYSTGELSDIWKKHYVDTIKSSIVYGHPYGVRLETKPKEDGSSVRVKLPSKPHKIFKSIDGDSVILLFDKQVSLPIYIDNKNKKKNRSDNEMKEDKKQKYIYFYDKVMPCDYASVLTTYNQTMSAIFETEDAEIKTTQMCFLSTDLIDKGYKIFLLDTDGHYEIKYGDFAGITITQRSDLFTLWEGGLLSRDKYSICRKLIENADNDVSYNWLFEQLVTRGISEKDAEDAIDNVVPRLFKSGKMCLTDPVY